MSEETTTSNEESKTMPSIVHDGSKIKIFSNENTYIEIDKGKIALVGNVVISGELIVTTGATGAITPSTPGVVQYGVVTGLRFSK